MDLSQFPITLTTAQIKDSSNKRYVTDLQLASIKQNQTNQQAGGDLTGFFPTPILNNLSVINQIITGFVASTSTTVLDTDTILSAIEKLQAQINSIPVLPTYIAQEIPTGTIDGTNTIFDLTHSAILNTEMVFVQGILKFRGIDYTITTNIITFITAPTIGVDVRVTYMH